jgi:hypothetical protein
MNLINAEPAGGGSGSETHPVVGVFVLNAGQWERGAVAGAKGA